MRENRLPESAPFYVPPLTRVLLVSIAHDAVNHSLLDYLRQRQQVIEAQLEAGGASVARQCSPRFCVDMGVWSKRMGLSTHRKLDSRSDLDVGVTASSSVVSSSAGGETETHRRSSKDLLSRMLMLEKEIT